MRKSRAPQKASAAACATNIEGNLGERKERPLADSTPPKGGEGKKISLALFRTGGKRKERSGKKKEKAVNYQFIFLLTNKKKGGCDLFAAASWASKGKGEGGKGGLSWEGGGTALSCFLG